VVVSLLGTVSITLGTIWQKRTAAGVDLRTNAVAQFLGAAIVVAPLALILEEGRLEPTGELVFGLFWAVFALSLGAIGCCSCCFAAGRWPGSRACSIWCRPPRR
jgi:drug/metabolite transporter (DMT)-like permease